MIKWRLPEQNPHFFLSEDRHPFSRISMLQTIQQKLSDHHCVALSGLSGSGKTSLAVEHSYREIAHYDEIYFFQGNDLVPQLREVVGDLKNQNTDNLEAHDLKNLFFKDNSIRKLLILDNVEPDEAISHFINFAVVNHAKLIITSNSQHWEHIICVNSFTHAESKDIIMKYLTHESADDIDKLVDCLGGLPLAVIQAIFYIKSTSISIDEYFQLFKENPDQLLGEGHFNFWRYNYPYSAYKALSLNIEKLKSKNKKCIQLLNYCVLFDYNNIPKMMLSKLFGSPIEFNNLVATLMSFSLIYISEDKKYFNLHCLIHHIIANALTKNQEKALLFELIKIVNQTYFYSRNRPEHFKDFLNNFNHYENFIKIGKKYLGTQQAFDYQFCLLLISMALHQTFEKHNMSLASYYFDYVEKVLNINGVTLKPNEYGCYLNGLGHNHLLTRPNNSNVVKSICEQALMYNNNVDIEVSAYAYNGIAKCEYINGRYEKAIEYFDIACQLIQDHFGNDHIDIPHFKRRLGIVYWKMNLIQKAKENFLYSLEVGKALFKDKLNFDSAGSAFFLGKIYEKYDGRDNKHKALSYYEYAHDVYLKLIGQASHPEIQAVKQRIDALKNSLDKKTKKKIIISRQDKDVVLSKREYECLKLVVKGLATKQIAKALFLSPRTIESHIANIKSKFHCKTKLELIAQLQTA